MTDLSAGYGGTPVVEGLSLVVEHGEIVALLGRNGAGKTTSLKAIMGLIGHGGAVTRGEVDISSLRADQRVRHGLAYVPQGRRIFGKLSVEGNIRVAAKGADRRSWQDAAAEVYEEFPVLAEKRQQPGGQLSGGQQQILALARALVSQPSVVLLDEPSEGIQPSIVDQIGLVLKKLTVERGISFVLVEQNLNFATWIADSVVVMDKGRVVLRTEPEVLGNDRELQHQYLGV